MDLALCMIVKNEQARIERCLDGIFGQFSEIIIVDTGSTDGTQALIHDRFGIEVIEQPMNSRFPTRTALRNLGFSLAKSPWIFVLDADERVDPHALRRFRSLIETEEASGYFFHWRTYLGEEVIDDYKLSAFRAGVEYVGHGHETVTPSFRAKELSAQWSNHLTIEHYPELHKLPGKMTEYEQRLRVGISHDPDWIRGHWFLGYTLFRQEKRQEAKEFLVRAARSNSTAFPVESLNARLVLAQILAAENRVNEAHREIEGGLAFHDQVADDFEVRINTRLRPWLERNLAYLNEGKNEQVAAYLFSH